MLQEVAVGKERENARSGGVDERWRNGMGMRVNGDEMNGLVCLRREDERVVLTP